MLRGDVCMKKRFFLVSVMMSLMLVLNVFSIDLNAATDSVYTSNLGFTYTLSEKGATITGYTKGEMIENLYIPSFVNGNKVIAIGDNAFIFNEQLENVIFSDDSSLLCIGINAFAACTSLKTINLPDTIKEIRDGAFQHCAFEKIELPNNLTFIGSSGFRNCTMLKSIVLPQTTEKLGDSAFIGCTLLETVSLSEKITEIADETFYGCDSLTNINIPKKVETIGRWAFYNCSSLTDLYISEQVKYINESAFQGCKKLIVYGEYGSYAAEYFRNNNLSFVFLKAPEIMLVGATKILIKAEDGFEYSIGDGAWQTNPLFVGRRAGGQCIVYAAPMGKTDCVEYLRYTEVVMNGQDEVPEIPNARHLVTLKRDILTNGKNMANDYNIDGRVSILDFIELKKIL